LLESELESLLEPSLLEEGLSSPPDDFESFEDVAAESSFDPPFDPSFDPFPDDGLYPSAYQPPPFRMKGEAEIRRRTFERHSWQRFSGSSVIRWTASKRCPRVHSYS
jgi:hypothetical protein